MKTFLIDANKCTACSLCIVACKDEHVGASYEPWTRPQPETGHFWMAVPALERGATPRVRMTYLPLLCQHCANAPCMKACGPEAIKRRDDGLVWIDPAACTGCGECKDACPYDVIYLNQELAIAQKCTGCAHRVDAGLLPRCADICPHDAIVFGEEATLLSPAAADLEVFHPEYHAKPRVLWRGIPKPWIAGMVVDPATDEVIAGAQVRAVDLFENGVVETGTDAFGEFWLRGLQKDRKYRVEIAKAGCRDFHAIVTTSADRDLGTLYLESI